MRSRVDFLWRKGIWVVAPIGEYLGEERVWRFVVVRWVQFFGVFESRCVWVVVSSMFV